MACIKGFTLNPKPPFTPNPKTLNPKPFKKQKTPFKSRCIPTWTTSSSSETSHPVAFWGINPAAARPDLEGFGV